ncbi:hypothetical protein TNCV_568611 [Trichonephila clavipes]|nr:hypothetical protein TNCV_568611 [Trichonephila clavipes]
MECRPSDIKNYPPMGKKFEGDGNFDISNWQASKDIHSILFEHVTDLDSVNQRTHKDPVGTALHIQEANMDDTTQTKTHTERAADAK